MMHVQSILPGTVVNVARTQATIVPVMVVNVMGVDCLALIVGVDYDTGEGTSMCPMLSAGATANSSDIAHNRAMCRRPPFLSASASIHS